MTKLKAIVLFDYDAEATDEHTLRVGDVLTNVKKIEEGWCQGMLKGKSGMFPDNFVKIEEDKPAPPKTMAQKPKKAAKRLVKVLFTYNPQNSDELKLVAGDIVEVLQDEEDGWAKGRVRDKEGVFPTNFCEPHTEKEAPAAAANTSEQTNGDVTNQILPKKVAGVGFGNIFSDGPVKLKKPPSSFETAPDKANAAKATSKPKTQAVVAKDKPTDKAHIPTTAANKKTKSHEKCRVTFDYEAQTGDELSLSKGDIVTIISKTSADEGWWEGETTDSNGRKKRGVFPDNFVVVLTADDENGDLSTKPSKASMDWKHSDEVEKIKMKPTDYDKSEIKSKNFTTAPSKQSNASKRPAPQLPSGNKSHSEVDGHEMNGMLEPASEEKQLTHYKRPVGPKNRRKPDAANRRERAKESADQEILELESESEESQPEEEEETKFEPDSSPPLNPAKKATMRGIQVMPSPSGVSPAAGGDTNETPTWLQQLRSRNSTKRESAPLSVAPKPEEPQNETPNWRANLRKNAKSATDGSPGRPPQPALPANKPITHFQSLKSPLSQTEKSDSPTNQTVDDSNIKFKPALLSHKSKSEANVLVNQAQEETLPEAKPEKPAEVKKPARPQTALQPPSFPIEKKPSSAGSKPKPPPAKAKPAVPASKPSSSSSTIDELKEELKSLKELFSQIQSEQQKEINRISDELETEKIYRLALQTEVNQLKKRV